MTTRTAEEIDAMEETFNAHRSCAAALARGLAKGLSTTNLSVIVQSYFVDGAFANDAEMDAARAELGEAIASMTKAQERIAWLAMTKLEGQLAPELARISSTIERPTPVALVRKGFAGLEPPAHLIAKVKEILLSTPGGYVDAERLEREVARAGGEIERVLIGDVTTCIRCGSHESPATHACSAHDAKRLPYVGRFGGHVVHSDGDRIAWENKSAEWVFTSLRTWRSTEQAGDLASWARDALAVEGAAKASVVSKPLAFAGTESLPKKGA